MIAKIIQKFFIILLFYYFIILLSVPIAKSADTTTGTTAAPAANAPKTCSQVETELKAAGTAKNIIFLSTYIPGLSQCLDEQKNTKYYITDLGSYIAVIYNIAIASVGILAAVMLTFGGFMWLSAGGNLSQIEHAKTYIFGALTGLILTLGAYSILYTINPQILTLKLDVEVIEAEEDVNFIGTISTATLQGDNIIGSVELSNELIPSVQAAARTLKGKGYGLFAISGLRSADKQLNLIRENCTNAQEILSCIPNCPATSRCKPKPGKPATCSMLKGPTSCPHTTGRAIDVWGAKGGSQCIMQKQCIANKTACANDPCQAAVISAMQAQGFCVLCSEPWHFEKPKMSSCCR
jgi:D-alanyl-D-alanine dipeptidase